jgi:hypothetical protein
VGEVVEWFEKYRLVETNIPNIIDKDSAIMIFNAGIYRINFRKDHKLFEEQVPLQLFDPCSLHKPSKDT